MTSQLSIDDCDSIVRRLWPYLDGKLPDSDMAIIAEHLRGCTACSSHFDFAQAFLHAVHELRPSEVQTDALRDKVVAALAREGYGEKA
jgi:anti-sigma factor RsiW